jgi:hypothetical protein
MLYYNISRIADLCQRHSSATFVTAGDICNGIAAERASSPSPVAWTQNQARTGNEALVSSEKNRVNAVRVAGVIELIQFKTILISSLKSF